MASCRKSQAYSMGKQRRLADFVNDKRLLHVPGPVYEIQAKDKIDFPKWSVGKEKRFAGRSVGTPGPGAYQERSFTDAGPKFTSRVKPFIDPFKMKTKPGPGFYDPQKPQT